MSEPIRLFVFGLGYSATALARTLKGRAETAGTSRDPERLEALAAEGFRALAFDGRSPGAGVAAALGQATHLLVSVAPGEADPVLAHHAGDILAAKNLRWIGYLSSVGVYGNYGGAWVSERTTPHPKTTRTVQRLAAEKAWAKLAGASEVPLAIFRLAGIYGPGRNAFVNLAEGRAHRVVKPGQVFNRIHVADIATTLAAALERNATGIFNLADDEPSPPQDVVAYAAGLMGVTPPPEIPFAGADLSPMAQSFYADNKRVTNAGVKQELGIALRYPSYREGLTALWHNGNWRE
ncbi:MAG: SDR family oxidoreductase [Bauldia sp.]